MHILGVPVVLFFFSPKKKKLSYLKSTAINGTITLILKKKLDHQPKIYERNTIDVTTQQVRTAII